jgi:elongin-C
MILAHADQMCNLADNFAEAVSNTCTLQSINGIVLEKVCEYLYYAAKNKDARDVPDMELPMELSLELLMAADFLEC